MISQRCSGILLAKDPRDAIKNLLDLLLDEPLGRFEESEELGGRQRSPRVPCFLARRIRIAEPQEWTAGQFSKAIDAKPIFLDPGKECLLRATGWWHAPDPLERARPSVAASFADGGRSHDGRGNPRCSSCALTSVGTRSEYH